MSAEAPTTKADWRRAFAASVRKLPREEARAAARAVAGAWSEVAAWRRVRRVALYAALRDELDLDPLAERLAGSGLPVLWPRVEQEDLVFVACPREALRPGAFGVLEPPAKGPGDPLREGDLVVVPGRGFDHEGTRLGRGRGYYDRFLAGRSELAILGVALEVQVVPRLPRDPHDVPMDALLTERGLRSMPPRDAIPSRPS